MTLPAHVRFPRPSLMGIVNATPDSFSDGGAYAEPDAAVRRVHELLADGAAIVDLGGESTRPGSDPVTADEELRRVVPVLERLGGAAPISIDTSKAEVARRALALGALMVNDVTALRGDPALADVVAEAGCLVCLMHMQGTPKTMQLAPRYDDVVAEVTAFLEERIAFCVAAGIPEERIVLDPGVGFGKLHEHNLALVRGLHSIVALGRPVLVGLSRKSLLGRLLGGDAPIRGTDAASVGAAAYALAQGATLFRVHDVAFHRDALAVAAQLADG
jgi:dihydropteroate synthase